jgi:ribonuclease P protein component
MLAADHRLRDSDAFRRTVRSGRRAGTAALVVHLLESPVDAVDAPVSSAEPARVGFVVNKAVGKAVVRNRVRRLLRPIVRQHLSDLPLGSALVVRALPPAVGLSSAELGIEFARCLQRVRRGAATSDRETAAARTGAPS